MEEFSANKPDIERLFEGSCAIDPQAFTPRPAEAFEHRSGADLSAGSDRGERGEAEAGEQYQARGVDRETAQKVADQMTMGKDDAILILDDNRISIAVGEEPADVRELNAVYAGAHASEVTDADEREE